MITDGQGKDTMIVEGDRGGNEGNPVFKEVWTLGHSSPLPLLSLPISPIDGLQITQEGPTPPPLTGCNSRNKKNLMTLQRDGELSIVHARFVGEFSRGCTAPLLHFSSLWIQRKSNATILTHVHNVSNYFLYDWKYTSSFLQDKENCERGNFIEFKKNKSFLSNFVNKYSIPKIALTFLDDTKTKREERGKGARNYLSRSLVSCQLRPSSSSSCN